MIINKKNKLMGKFEAKNWKLLNRNKLDIRLLCNYESDEERFGGYQRLNDAHKRWYESFKEGADSLSNNINI